MNVNLMDRAAANIRILITEMVEKAKSGHPGGALGAADFINVLFSRFMVYDPADPNWFARDRFFLDPGHMSPMLYSVLALTGRYSLDDLKEFRQWGSVTPGHPEVDVARGVENTSGPLGQGHAMAVGCAIAERFITARCGESWAHKTYAFISDGGIQEEVSQGAGRIAGMLGLHNLIMFYDSNDVQLSTRVSEVTGEDTAAKYRAWGWNVIEIDGSDPLAIAGALGTADRETDRPTLIIGHTVMARGVLTADGGSLEGAVSTHGQPLSKAGADIRRTIESFGGDPDDPWKIFPEVEKLYADRREELRKIVAGRRAAQEAWKSENPEMAARLADWIAGRLPELDWNEIPLKEGMATRAASAAVLGYLAKHVGNMIVSSADLANSDKTDGFLKETRPFGRHDFGGAFLHAGVAELTMACLMNGMSLHGGVIPACGTFFVFSDYMKPAIRLSALMEQPVKYIFSHDSFRVGEDGPTHEPIEQETQIRLLERMTNFSGRRAALVLRPADSAETVEAYRLAMENNGSPSILILSRQNLADLPAASGDRRAEARGVGRGAYAVIGRENPDVILLGNGSDVSLLCDAAALLADENIHARVVSIPSVGLFLDQEKEYRDALIPGDAKVFAVSSGLPDLFYPVVGRNAGFFGLQRFGASAPAGVLDREFGFTAPDVAERVKHFLRF